MKMFQKWLSLFLTLVLLCNMLPLQIMAEELQAAAGAEQSDTAQATPAYIVGELESERTAYSKEFLMSDGLHMAVLYPSAVHYQTDSGWVEIDNTLKAADGVYTNTAGDWSVSFPQTLTGSSPVSVTRDGHTVSFTMDGELRLPFGNVQLQGGLSAGALEQQEIQALQTSQAQVQTLDLTQALAAAEYPETVPTKLNSRLRYSNVYNGTHIIYDLAPGQVKESIVLEAYSDSLRGYRYTLNTGDLVPALQEDGSIYLLSRNSEEPVMVMPAPYLEDAANATSYDVSVSLTGSKGSYTLTYQLPQTWLASADRQWPVVLDPVIVPDMDVDNVRDCSIFSLSVPKDDKNTPAFRQGALCLGQHQYFGKMRSFLKYAELPAITSSDVVVYAELQLYLGNRADEEVAVQVHKVNSLWESQTLNWNDHNNIWDETIQDYQFVPTDTKDGVNFFDITDIVRGWYTDQNTGLMLRTPDEVENATGKYAGDDNLVQFYSSDFDAVYHTKSPVVVIKFRNNNGLEEYWDYTSASAGRAGAGSVNNFTGNLTWTFSDMGFGGNRMPVDISHVYNLNDINNLPNDGNNSNDSGGNAFGMGIGWRTNFNQLLYQWNVNSGYYVLEDSDGTDHYFYKDNTEVGTYFHENNEKIILTVNNSGDNPYCITDETGNTTWFDAHGRLTKISNNQETPSSVIITYTSNSSRLISNITDGVGRKYSFTYANGLLSRISFTGTGTEEISYVSYGYEGNLLTSVTYKDGETCSYTYDANNCLISAQDIDGYQLSYTYNTVSAAWQPWRVQSVKEAQVRQDNSEITGSELTFSYSHNQTILTDHRGNRNILQFNDYGDVVSIQDGEGHAQFAQYALNTQQEADSNTDASARKNQLRLSSKLQNTVGNLLQNGASFSNWQAIGGATLAAGEAMLHGSSLQVTATGNGGAASPVFTVQPEETVTFSAYVKNPNAAAKLAICGEDLSILAEGETLAISDAWTRTQVTYTNNTGAALSLRACFFGTGYLDHAQVEKAQTASRYNLVENGDFRFGLAGWTGNSGSVVTAASAAAPTLEASAFSVTGSPTVQKRLTQTLSISGAKDDCYVLTGWAMGNSVPLPDDSNRRFALSVTFLDANGDTVNECFTQFNPDMDASNGWQYAACPAAATGDYSSIQVSLCYDHNANTVYFDGIQLYKEQFGVSYTYDPEGNVKSVVDIQNQETKYVYDENNTADLAKVILPTNVTLEYTYDLHHNVTSATSSSGMLYSLTYDEYGNNTSVTLKSETGNTSSSAAYTENGNFPVSATDALGNTTYYGYDPNTGLKLWVRYPENSEAQRTEYTYDNMYRLVLSEIDLDGSDQTNNSLSAKYSYTNDLLASIETASTVYTFSYGSFNLRESIAIGNRTLASYDYTNDQNKDLQALAYGNGDMIVYTYDDQGRLTAQTYEDGDTVTYSYDNDGALARIHDSATGITTTYYYDLIGRQMKYVESGTNYTHSVGYNYNAQNNLTELVESINGTDYTTVYTYDTDNRIKTITVGSTTKTYHYDKLGRITAKVTTQGEDEILREEFVFNPGADNETTSQVSIYKVTKAGYTTEYSYTYDDRGNIISVTDGTNIVTYAYDAANQLIREDDLQRGYTRVWEYDNAGNILSRKEYAYTLQETLTAGTETNTVSYDYGDEEWGDLLTSYEGNAIVYDEIGNPLSDREWSYDWEHGRQLSSMETYQPIKITVQPESFTGEVGNTASFHVSARGVDLTYSWKFSNNGGETWWSSTADGNNTHTLQIEATAARSGYLYRCVITDAEGNSRTTNPAELDCGDVKNPVILEYPQYYEGQLGDTAAFTVSARGNNLAYQWQFSKDGGSSWWNSTATGSTTDTLSIEFTEARRNYLYRCKVTDGEDTLRVSIPAGFVEFSRWEYTYNSDGIRTSRADSATTYNYTYNGGQLTHMTVGNNELHFGYDVGGVPMTVTLNGTVYYYTVNLQGDIIGICNSAGTTLVTYSYDTWGNPLSTTTITEAQSTDTSLITTASTLAHLNPLRYRGYVYDIETGLYYNISRYYNPVTGRWISSDIFTSTSQGILGNNMFAYCGNNPVNRVDVGGCFWDTIFDVVSLVVSVVEVVSDPTDVGAWVGLALDVVDVLIPCVGGLGEAADVINAANKVADVADDLHDAGKALDAVDDIHDAGKGVQETLDAITDASKTLKEGSNSVYIAYKGNVIEYVGITNDFKRRQGEWQGVRDIVEYIPGLDREGARFVEQAVIDTFGMSKNGGLLTNKINSIGRRNPIYSSYQAFLEIIK